MASNITKQEKEVFSKLDKITDNSIYAWLDDIKKGAPHVDAESRVINPLTKKSKIYTNKDGTYPIIIRWCLENLKGYDFTGVPNIKNIIAPKVSSNGAKVSTNTATAAKVSSKSPEDIILILKEWKENPTIDPYTGKQIDISIKDDSEYVALYKHTIDKLINHILTNKPGQSKNAILSVQDCRHIKDTMPNIHSLVNIKNANNNIIDTIYYDDLFMKYFLASSIKLKTKTVSKYKYDGDYYKDIEPYLYLIIYDNIQESFSKISVKTQNIYNTTEKLLKSHHFNLSGTQNQLGHYVEKLCVDIKNILYMHESKISTEKINLAIFNKEVLKYMLSISKISLSNNDIMNELRHYYRERYYQSVNGVFTLKNMVHLSSLNRNYPLNNLYYIYTQIVEHLAKDNNICKTLIDVYDTILKLYGDNNIKNTVFKYIKDPYNSNKGKGVEPQMPLKPQLSRDLQMYKIRLNNFKNAAKADSSNERKKEELRKFEIENQSNEQKLKEYEKKMQEWPNKLKEYEKKKDIYDRIYEGKMSIKHNKWDGELFKKPKKMHKSENNRPTLSWSAPPPSVSLVKYSNKIKAFTTTSHINKSISSNDIEYVNDSDPYTQENFEEMHPNKQKYLTDIVYYDNKNKAFHYRFDTVSIYNYILKCIEDCKKPYNYYTNSELTNDNLNEICRKIKHFTKKPTYNSYLDIRASLDNCKYENHLSLNYKQEYLQQYTPNPIIGYLKIYLNIDLGGILFRVINRLPRDLPSYDNFPNQTNSINSEVLIMPTFAEYIYDIYDETTHVYPVHILLELQQKLPKGDILGTKYFPYRKNNVDNQRWKNIINIPKFDLNLEDNADEVFEKLKVYKDKISLL
jgi:hypothetical protein